jgi:hypothetical protein
MADPINPNDPFTPTPTNDPATSYRGGPARLDNDLQADPELAEGPASGGRIAVFAVGIVVVLGAVFYGLNNTATTPDATKTATSAPASTAAPANNVADSGSSKPAVPPGVRDVTPSGGTNTQQGMTTGSAPSRPQPLANAPTGTEVDQSKTGANK